MDLLRSLPLGLYLEKPFTWLHRLDPRVKLAWLMSFLISPLLASPAWRVILVVLLVLLTFLAAIPLRVWRQQMGWLLTLCLLVFLLTCVFPDGLAVDYQPRLPASEITLPQPGSYQYVVFNFSTQALSREIQITITRRSVDLAIRISTLVFTLLYSTNLFLLTTAPEEITAGLEDLLQPLQRVGLPVTEIVLTLTLSLRFIPLVLEEIQNLWRSIRTRAINWQKLGIQKSLQIWLVVAERLLENLLLRAEQIAMAMDVRGFTSPSEHRVEWHQLRLRARDWFALGCLAVLWWARLAWGGMNNG